MAQNVECQVSIVVPMYNEQDNLALLIEEISAAMDTCAYTWELVLVDDGSRDETVARAKQLCAIHPHVKLVALMRNYGQTAALHAGIQHAQGEIIVTMDGDLQNDPRDIPRMLETIQGGYDLVNGWRRDRQDAWVNRKLPSRIANWLIRRVTGVSVRDLGCTLRAMRSDLAKQMELYGEMHRFIPILAHQLGARSTEIETHHRARRFGVTKYGIGRTTRVLFDLITVKYMLKYFDSPMKLFGQIGLWVGALAVASFAAVLAMKLSGTMRMMGNPLLLLGVLSTILSVQFFSLGLIGEVNARIYFSQGTRRNYQVRDKVNFDRQTAPSDYPVVVKRAA